MIEKRPPSMIEMEITAMRNADKVKQKDNPNIIKVLSGKAYTNAGRKVWPYVSVIVFMVAVIGSQIVEALQ